MQLLVSVRTGEEARAAVVGGAGVIDAKDPAAGALGAVSIATFREILAAVADRAPVSAALGDADDEERLDARARSFAAAGAHFVKVGFGGVGTEERVAQLLKAAVRGVSGTTTRVVAVAYADHREAGALPPAAIAAAAARLPVRGVLLDTAAKQGPRLCELMALDALDAWVRAAKSSGLLVGLAGRVVASEIERLCGTGADIVGVRGAACDGDRLGTISATRVRALAELTTRVQAAGLGQSTGPRLTIQTHLPV
jgi:uncharacterized protein (UPF0264 family)